MARKKSYKKNNENNIKNLVKEFTNLFRVKDFIKKETVLFELENAKDFLDKILDFYDIKNLEEKQLYKSALFLLTKARLCLLSISEQSTGELEGELSENMVLRENLLSQARKDILQLTNGKIDIESLDTCNSFSFSLV